MNRWGNGFGRQGGLNFTRFADSRNGGGNAMGKGGGSREREWGILTVTYRQRAEQSKQSICEQFIWAIPHPVVETSRDAVKPCNRNIFFFNLKLQFVAFAYFWVYKHGVSVSTTLLHSFADVWTDSSLQNQTDMFLFWPILSIVFPCVVPKDTHIKVRCVFPEIMFLILSRNPQTLLHAIYFLSINPHLPTV